MEILVKLLRGKGREDKKRMGKGTGIWRGYGEGIKVFLIVLYIF